MCHYRHFGGCDPVMGHLCWVAVGLLWTAFLLMWKTCLSVCFEMMRECWVREGLLCFAVVVILDVLAAEGEVGK